MKYGSRGRKSPGRQEPRDPARSGGRVGCSGRAGGGCPAVGRGWASRRRRTPLVPLRRLRPPRAAARRRGPAGAGVAPGNAQDLPRGHDRAPCLALLPGAPCGPLRRAAGAPGGSPPQRKPTFRGGVTKSTNTGARTRRAEGRPWEQSHLSERVRGGGVQGSHPASGSAPPPPPGAAPPGQSPLKMPN